jgi:hypothetical protein
LQLCGRLAESERTAHRQREGRWTFYAIEYSDKAPDGTPNLFFGYLLNPLGPDCDELCYLSLQEMERQQSPRLRLPVERDLWFEPRPLSDVREGTVSCFRWHLQTCR